MVTHLRRAEFSSLRHKLWRNRFNPTIHPATIPPTSFLIFLFTVAFFCPELASSQSLQPDDQRNTLHGTVVNAVTHEPIGRALVHSPGDRFAMLTDSEGHFEFTLPGSGSEGTPSGESQPSRKGPTRVSRDVVWLTGRKPGFLEGPNEGQIRAFPGADNTISLMPEALIKGRVTLSGNDPAVGSDIQLFLRQVQNGIYRWLPAATSRTNSNGEFRFAGLRAGAYIVMTHELMDTDPADITPGGPAYGFPPVYYPNATNFATAGTIQVAPAQTFQAELSLVRQPYYAVSIPVANENEKEEGGMRITVSINGRRSPGFALTYNSGKRRIEGLLPNGNYLVEAATFGPNSATVAANIRVNGEPIEGPRVVLARKGSISLRVKEEFTSTDLGGASSSSNGNQTSSIQGPRAYLNVSAESADDLEEEGGAMRPPAGAEDNSLVIDNLAPGRYWLQLRSSRGYVASATSGGVDVLHEPLVVASGSTTTVEITMRDDGAKIEGKLASPNEVPTTSSAPPNAASPAPQGFVYCIPSADGPGQFQQFSVGSDGRFTSPLMAPGTYRVVAFPTALPSLPYRDAEAMRAYDAKGQVIQLSAGQRKSVQLQITSSND